MIGEIRYYKGQFKVRVVAQTEENWIVEALEDITYEVKGEKIQVKTGDQQVIPTYLLHKQKRSFSKSKKDNKI